MFRYTRCTIVIMMAATAWLMLTVLFKCPQGTFLWGHLKSTVYESNPHTIQELKDNISHAVAAIKITMLHPVYLNMIRHAQLCVDAGGNHFQASSMTLYPLSIWLLYFSVFTLCYEPGLLFRGPLCSFPLLVHAVIALSCSLSILGSVPP